MSDRFDNLARCNLYMQNYVEAEEGVAMENVLLIEADATRRSSLRKALYNRGHSVCAEASSVSELFSAIGSLEFAPTTVMVGSSIPERVGQLLKRTWPGVTVICESSPPAASVAI